MLIKYLLGEATEAEVEEIQIKLAEDPGYRKYFEQLKAVWDASHNLAVPSAADENAAWQRFKNRVTYQQQQPVKKIRWMKVAAAAAVLLGIGLISVFIFNKKNLPKEIVFQSMQQVVKDTLPDASVVTLNKNSALSYPEAFKGDTRHVSLKGEAFFSVTPNKAKPFIISVNNVEVKVVGTSFNIKSNGGNTEIIVETGIVQVTQFGKTILLGAGEKMVAAKENLPLKKEGVGDKLYNYYRTKEFVCDNTPLWKLVDVLNEAYDTNIVIKNGAIKNLAITTTFYNEPLENILLIISQTLNVTVTKNNNVIVLQ